MAANRLDLPDLGLGLGLRAPHVREILDSHPAVGFFEVISENYMDTRGRPLQTLDAIAARYPVVMHGVSMSLGSADPLDRNYLRKLKQLAHRCRASWVSDHLCWTGVLGINTHDLLPLPYTEAALAHVTARIREASDFLERPLVIENPSSYVRFAASCMPEHEFLARMAEDADCGLLLDVNNVYVSARNHGFDPDAYVDAVPADRVVQIHLAGHSDNITHVIDTHDDHVVDEVWRLYARLCARTGPVSTMIEWDARIPSFEVLHSEVQKAAPLRHGGVPHVAAR